MKQQLERSCARRQTLAHAMLLLSSAVSYTGMHGSCWHCLHDPVFHLGEAATALAGRDRTTVPTAPDGTTTTATA